MPSKRFKKLPENTKDLSAEAFEKLIPVLKKNCTTKFDESLDLSFQINNKQKKSEVNIRTVVNLPGGTGKNVKVAVVCEDSKAQEAKDAGGGFIGEDEPRGLNQGSIHITATECIGQAPLTLVSVRTGLKLLIHPSCS